jgi:hypothetical protein
MDDIISNAPITVAIIDYIGKIGEGVSLLMCLVTQDETFEFTYWYDRKGNIRLVPEQRLLDRLKVKNIYEYVRINELVYFIHHSIPDPDKILDEFLQ